MKLLNLKGRKFGRWTVLGRSHGMVTVALSLLLRDGHRPLNKPETLTVTTFNVQSDWAVLVLEDTALSRR